MLGDNIDEPPALYGEWGIIALSNATGQGVINPTIDPRFYGLGVFIIIDDDDAPVITPGVAAVLEGDSGSVDVEVPVTLSNPSAVPVTVDWRTLDTGGAGIATADVDYQAASGTVTFAPGQTSATVTITVYGDTIDEPPALYGEWGLLAFSNPDNATIDPGFFGLGVFIIIIDDD